MNLSEIVRVFNSPINEEQVWAICHQHSKRLSEKEFIDGKYFTTPKGLDSIRLKQNGEVLVVGDDAVHSEREFVDGFGRVLFDALQYGLDLDHEEHELSPELERLIERMTLNYDGITSDERDEGYDAEGEEDSNPLDHGPCTLDVVVEFCEKHLDLPDKADSHYQAVCQALITEASDLKFFLEKVSRLRESLNEFNNLNNNNDISGLSENGAEFPELNYTEWAHVWIQVVGDLRSGVKLKKIEGYTRNVEFELTPYEILMRDIRQRKFTLRKVAVNGDIPPRIKHDAHDIILEFIKSRPTLNPSKDRKLRPPPPRSKSLHERLIEQIQEHATPLRHIEPPDDSPIRKRRSMDSKLDRSKSFDLGRCETSTQGPSRRRLIKAPTFSEIQVEGDTSSASDSEIESDTSVLSEDLSTTVFDDSTSSHFKRHSLLSNTSSLRSSGTSGVSSNGCDDGDKEKVGVFTRNTATIRRKKLLPVELLPSPVLTPLPDTSVDSVPPLRQSFLPRRNVGLRRANSMAAVPSPSVASTSGFLPMGTAEEKRVTWRERRMVIGQRLFSTPSESHVVPLPPPAFSSSPLAKRDRRDTNTGLAGGNGKSLQRAFSERRQSRPKAAYDNWRYPMECLALTVEELIHIRQVLARAELEKYQGQGELYSNLKRGKVCFNCRVRKFSILWWACSCQICQQRICSKCMRKVRTPTNEYLQTPVYTLSPSLNPQYSAQARLSENFPEMTLWKNDNGPPAAVLRERNGVDSNSRLLRQQYRAEGASTSGQKSRKMDVCEECCDLISRIIQTNRIATLQNSPEHNAAEGHPLSRQVSSPTTGCWSYSTTRVEPPADRVLRRSVSNAQNMSSYREMALPSRSMQSLQAFAK